MTHLTTALLAVSTMAFGAGPPSLLTAQDRAGAAIPSEVVKLHKLGFGAKATGGEGGTVVWVTNLNDSGLGSFRNAMAMRGSRIVKFKVGGEIQLLPEAAGKKWPRIRTSSGDVTVDGLSAAPYGGITLLGGLYFEHAQNIIVRHLRCRGGEGALGLNDDCRRAIIDHCSVSWADDQNLDAWRSSDITFQWCIIAEGNLINSRHDKGPHSMGSLQGGGATRVTTHHCLFVSNVDRNPMTAGLHPSQLGSRIPDYRFDVINNTVYNYINASRNKISAHTNYIGNYYRPGPDTDPSRVEIGIEASYLVDPRARDYSKVYVKGNVGPHRPEDKGDELSLVGINDPHSDVGGRLGRFGPAADHFLSDTPLPTPAYAQIEAEPAMEAYEKVMEYAGAWPRDPVDRRLLEEVRDLKGKVGRVGPLWKKMYSDNNQKNKAKTAAK